MGIVAELLNRDNRFKIDILAQQWQWQLLSEAELMKQAYDERIAFHDYLCTLTYANALSATEADRSFLVDWVEGLRDSKYVRSADICVSDNSALPLAIRPDTLLVGSFLWCEVFEALRQKNTAIVRYIEQERKLLSELNPPILCVGDISTPSVKALPNSQLLAWMCDSIPLITSVRSRSGLKQIGLLGGATGLVDTELAAFADSLTVNSELCLDVPASIARKCRSDRIRVFDFSDEAYRRFDAVICRPGVGTITKCVEFEIPMILLTDETNFEMKHNSKRIEELGIGFRSEARIESIQFAIEQIRENCGAIMKNFRKLKKNGLTQTVDWIMKQKSSYGKRNADGFN